MIPEAPLSRNGHEAGPFRLETDAFGRLVLIDAAGQSHVGVAVCRAFPISAPSTGVALTDSHGRELAWIDDLADLPADQRQIIEAQLAQREFTPVIGRILRVHTVADKSEWEVETDRGRTTFRVSGDHDVRPLEGGRAMLVDDHGIRYLIASVAGLDRASQRFLERFL